MAKGTPTPWPYTLIRLLFQFTLKVFYGTIVVSNAHFIPETGKPCIVCANHSNSLTDALLLVTSVPSNRRNMLRLTAKSTQFGRKTFTSWLIESAGTVPIHRRKDFDVPVDNSQAMEALIKALEAGDAVMMFPEGMSRFHPTIAPLKTGVARLASDVLSQHRDDPQFEIYILNCSITYMHRQHWRSDVLVTWHPPMVLRPKDNPELLKPVKHETIRAVTTQIYEQISSGTFDSPSWHLVQLSKLAARMYAPLGTTMSLGDHVRITRTFLEAFKDAHEDSSEENQPIHPEIVKTMQLQTDLKEYQHRLMSYGIKDDRVRRPLSRHDIVRRMTIRLFWSCILFSISIPGLVLWLPVILSTLYAVHEFKKSGPIFDTFDEIAQYKLIYGLMSGICVWLGGVILTLPFALVTIFLIPATMWMTLRWMEDCIASSRAFFALFRLLRVGKHTLNEMRILRNGLHREIVELGISLGLPPKPEEFFVLAGGQEKGRVVGPWQSKAGYFSIRRRRKRDWNETLRLYDKVDYPDDDS
ncbi:hypothetical protein J3R30DRAFT_3285480 [Lentinula aciculospora]|uniref:Phospholipid/glycerol acyltransferase domain-containing protein n=1 Tax=Lentinula aciculospora TaxID=153920 RepID=A0A9W9AJF9_9AGAR|nr:hypothetical protein J3R30DRAFT_3285480 [Lentinula aciculospora]